MSRSSRREGSSGAVAELRGQVATATPTVTNGSRLRPREMAATIEARRHGRPGRERSRSFSVVARYPTRERSNERCFSRRGHEAVSARSLKIANHRRDRRIAFQTNSLALNAAVEAARVALMAAPRVGAGEISLLAKRSAVAARESDVMPTRGLPPVPERARVGEADSPLDDVDEIRARCR